MKIQPTSLFMLFALVLIAGLKVAYDKGKDAAAGN